MRLVEGLGGVDDSVGDPIRILDNLDLDRVTMIVRNLGWVKIPFYPEITSCFLRPTDPLLNNWFKVTPINLNPSRANEKLGPLVQDLDSVLKGTTYLLSQKWVGVNSVLHPMSLTIHSVLSLKWEAYWASDDELSSPMQI
ncbi:hypothetical protein E5676_scaffold108G00030 [Cucumis melo var. makuwa]|uniref:Uncharacterized protein n=1 Tax=Cucumis melo var. makuwa TaxID=1194695 RepID=A0A5D3BZP3_CUCMM|nr:hypothetical protein E5676_scaffold108G00030 [Cucumis melo var. makuwa]